VFAAGVYILSLRGPVTPRDAHSFPTRRSSDLRRPPPGGAEHCDRARHARRGCRARAALRLAEGRPRRPRPADRRRRRAVLRLLPDRKSTRLNSSHVAISYAVFCLKKKKQIMVL